MPVAGGGWETSVHRPQGDDGSAGAEWETEEEESVWVTDEGQGDYSGEWGEGSDYGDDEEGCDDYGEAEAEAYETEVEVQQEVGDWLNARGWCALHGACWGCQAKQAGGAGGRQRLPRPPCGHALRAPD